MAYVEMFGRDMSRFRDARVRMNESPLGAAALAGTSFPIDREATAAALGFDRPSANSLDAVSDRDFALEFLSSASICATHLSRFAEELVIWSSAQFRFVVLSDRFSTGSSIMPNKNNPDVIEVMRASLSVVEGSMMQIQSLMSLPSGYQRDLQLSKGPLIKGIETTKATLQLLPNLLNSITFKTENMADAVSEDMLATDHALEAVKNGAHFRDAYLNAKSDNQSADITVASSIANRVSLGGAANLGLDMIKQRLKGLGER